MDNNETICTVVVTYNRKDLLIECLSALLMQTRAVSGIYIIDNNSTDGTAVLLKEKGYLSQLPPEKLSDSWEDTVLIKKILSNSISNDSVEIAIHYVCMPENTGGAGGFHEGIKRGYDTGYDKIWLMDDDVEPFPNTLQNLLQYVPDLENVGFLNSKIVGVDKTSSLNVPNIDTRPSKNGYPKWDTYLDIGIVKVRTATFVSCLIGRNVIEEIGLPIKEMFIWGDDTEYTRRITDIGYCGYYVGNSRAIHKRHNQKNLSILDETDIDRIKLHYYFYRNHFYMNRRDGYRNIVGFIKRTWFVIIKITFSKNNNKYLKVKTIISGMKDGVKFLNKI